MKELSRRDFLKGGAASAATIGLGVGLAGCSTNSVAEQTGGASGAAQATEMPEGQFIYPGINDFNWENAKFIDPVDPPSEWDDEADVVVVGSGAGGLFASAFLANKGNKVICLEASAKLNGTSEWASYLVTLGGIPSLHTNEDGSLWGRESIPYDEEVIYQLQQNRFNWTVDPDLLRAAIKALPNGIEWLIQQGLDIVDAGHDWGLPEDQATNIGAVNFRGAWFPEGTGMLDWGYVPDGLVQRPLMDAIANLGRENGADFRTGTKVIGLVFDGERVIGVKAIVDQSEEIFVKANKAVTLHAGGMSYNRELVTLYCPAMGRGMTNSVEAYDNDGTSLRMCLGLGAGVVGAENYSTTDGSLDMAEVQGTSKVLYHSMFAADSILPRQAWLRMNKIGQRLQYFDYLGGSQLNNASSLENPILIAEGRGIRQEYSTVGQREIVIFDDKWRESIKILGTPEYGGTAGRKYLDDSIEYPWRDDPDRGTIYPHDFEGDIQRSVDAGYIKTANTLEELAELLGVDYDKVKKNVDEWNAKVEAGEGDPDYGYSAKVMNVSGKIDTPPFFAAKLGARTYTTLAGVRINDQGQVVNDENHEPIPGLYAGFHTAGGLAGYLGGTHEPLYSDVGTSMCGGIMCADGIINNE